MYRVAAQAPLTYEEKKILIANIMKLDGDQMTSVVDIIQSAMPHTACGDGDEVEIPVDELDTYTLRQLQDYVQVCAYRSPVMFIFCLLLTWTSICSLCSVQNRGNALLLRLQPSAVEGLLNDLAPAVVLPCRPLLLRYLIPTLLLSLQMWRCPQELQI